MLTNMKKPNYNQRIRTLVDIIHFNFDQGNKKYNVLTQLQSVCHGGTGAPFVEGAAIRCGGLRPLGKPEIVCSVKLQSLRKKES